LKSAAARLIEKANANGGPDNITVVIARWVA
jgi:protein phosphatase